MEKNQRENILDLNRIFLFTKQALELHLTHTRLYRITKLTSVKANKKIFKNKKNLPIPVPPCLG